jgi:hypothetical protein
MPPKKRKNHPPYTKGQLNKIIDSFLHPHYSENESLRLLDGLLHGLVEKNPPESIRKFIRYNMRPIIKKITKRSQ